MLLTSSQIVWLLLASQAGVGPTSVPQPVYPAIAESARVTGDVAVALMVRPDGSVASAEVQSGPPLLRDAALKAAREATYECRGCTESGTPYTLVFRFQLVPRQDPRPPSGLVRDPDGRATVYVVGTVGYWYEGAVFARTRSRARALKCLWLWKCGVR